MKKIMTMVSAIMMAAAANATPKSEPVENTKELEAFSETVLNVPARVRIVKGEDYKVDVRSNNTEVAKSIKCVVENGVLKFYVANSDGLPTDEEIVITIVAPRLPTVKTGKNFTIDK